MNTLIYYDSNAKPNKKFKLGTDEDTLEPEETETIKKRGVTVDGGASSDGKYGWINRLEWEYGYFGNSGDNIFRYYGPDGIVHWEKKTVTGVTVPEKGDLIFLLEADSSSIKKLDFETTPPNPTILTSSGGVVAEFKDCVSYDKSWEYIAKEYVSVNCYEATNSDLQYKLIFHLKTKTIEKKQ